MAINRVQFQRGLPMAEFMDAQPVGGSPSPPTLSHEYAGEGWGRSRAFEPHAASLRSGPGLQAQTRAASEGGSSSQGPWLKLLADQVPSWPRGLAARVVRQGGKVLPNFFIKRICQKRFA